MVAPFLAIYLGRTLGFNATQTGLVLGAGAITGLPAALFAGSLTARFGARRVLSWSMALAGIALAGFALVESLALLATAAATMRLGPQSMSLREPC